MRKVNHPKASVLVSLSLVISLLSFAHIVPSALAVDSVVRSTPGDLNLTTVTGTGGGVLLNSRQTGVGLFVNTSNNVGIGHTSPLALLDVYQSGDVNRDILIRGDRYASLRIWGEYDNGNTKGPILNLGTGNNGSSPTSNWYMGLHASDSNKLKIGYRNVPGWGAPADNDLLTVDTSGNVGIGTTTPGQKLSVAGTIESTSGGFKFPDGTVQTSSSSGSATMNAANVSSGAFGSNTGGGNYSFPVNVDLIGGRISIRPDGGAHVLNGAALAVHANNPIGSFGDAIKTRADAGSHLVSMSSVNGNPAFRIYGNNGSNGGRADLQWSDMAASPSWDTNLYRSAADTLKTDDEFHVGAAARFITGFSGGNFAISGDQSQTSILSGLSSIRFNIDRSGDGNQQFTIAQSGANSITDKSGVSLFSIVNSNGLHTAIGGTAASSPTSGLFQLRNDTASQVGGMTFGTAADTNLYRNAAGVLRTNSNLVIDGNVGIGTANPGSPLEVKGSSGAKFSVDGSNGDSYLRLTMAPGNYYDWLQLRDDTSAIIGQLIGYKGQGLLIDSGNGYPIIFRPQGTEKMRIDSSGNVGIGTTAPTYKLDVVGNTPGLRIKSTGVSDYPTLRLESSNASGALRRTWDLIAGSDTNDAFRINDQTAGAERLRIDPSGNVGIGTTSPTSGYKLDINGSMKAVAFNDYDNTSYYVDPNVASTLNNLNMLGTPTAPTAGAGTNNTQVATTAFVQAAVSAAGGQPDLYAESSNLAYNFNNSAGWYQVDSSLPQTRKIVSVIITNQGGNSLHDTVKIAVGPAGQEVQIASVPFHLGYNYQYSPSPSIAVPLGAGIEVPAGSRISVKCTTTVTTISVSLAYTYR